jgi:hypothetical protein
VLLRSESASSLKECFFAQRGFFAQWEAKLAASVVDTRGKFATDVVDTGGKFATGVNDTKRKFSAYLFDTGRKFATGVDTGGAPWLANLCEFLTLMLFGEDDSWEKPETKISWHHPFKGTIRPD